MQWIGGNLYHEPRFILPSLGGVAIQSQRPNLINITMVIGDKEQICVGGKLQFKCGLHIDLVTMLCRISRPPMSRVQPCSRHQVSIIRRTP